MPTLRSSGKVLAGGGGLLSAYWTNSFASHRKQILRILDTPWHFAGCSQVTWNLNDAYGRKLGYNTNNTVASCPPLGQMLYTLQDTVSSSSRIRVTNQPRLLLRSAQIIRGNIWCSSFQLPAPDCVHARASPCFSESLSFLSTDQRTEPIDGARTSNRLIVLKQHRLAVI